MLTWRDGWPVKTRELHNHHFDSTAWNDFAFRDDDIVIATYAKAGTTWTQQIVDGARNSTSPAMGGQPPNKSKEEMRCNDTEAAHWRQQRRRSRYAP